MTDVVAHKKVLSATVEDSDVFTWADTLQGLHQCIVLGRPNYNSETFAKFMILARLLWVVSLLPLWYLGAGLQPD